MRRSGLGTLSPNCSPLSFSLLALPQMHWRGRLQAQSWVGFTPAWGTPRLDGVRIAYLPRAEDAEALVVSLQASGPARVSSIQASLESLRRIIPEGTALATENESAAGCLLEIAGRNTDTTLFSYGDHRVSGACFAWQDTQVQVAGFGVPVDPALLALFQLLTPDQIG